MQPDGEPAISSPLRPEGGRDPGSAVLRIPPENMRQASNEMYAMADSLENDAVVRLSSIRVEPAGNDSASQMVAARSNAQVHDPDTGGLPAAIAAVANLRAGAEEMARRAAVYEAQEQATAASFRTDPGV